MHIAWNRKVIRHSLLLFALAAAGLILIHAELEGAAEGFRPLGTIRIQTERNGGNIPVTFGMPFPKGTVRENVAFQLAERRLQCQIDPKRHYADGSLKHAVVTLFLGPLEAGKSAFVRFGACRRVQSARHALSDLPEGFSAEVEFRFPDGTLSKAVASSFLQKAAARDCAFPMTWYLHGPLSSELRLTGPPCIPSGEPDKDLLVTFGLRWYRDLKAVRVEVVVENSWVDTPGNIPYEVTIRVGGRAVFTERSVGFWRWRLPYWLKGKDRSLGHFAYSRWRKIFWWGEAPPRAYVFFDPAYLAGTGLLPPYDTHLALDPERVKRTWRRWERSRRGILENGVITGYFPTTGGREDLGPYPAWTVVSLLSGDLSAWKVVWGTGELAGSFPVHVRDRSTGSFLSIDKHPGFSLNRRGTLEQIKPRAAPDRPYVRPAVSPYQVDAAHQPSLAFVPYLLTGEAYYLEEMVFWANWCMLKQNAVYRKGAKGLLLPDQVRGEAWALRQLVDAAKTAPDTDPARTYFDAKVKTNLAAYLDFVTGPHATPLGTYTIGASDAYVRGRPPAERRKWLTLAPWQQNFLVWSLDHALRAGYKEARIPRDYFARLQIGMLTNPESYDPRYAAPYYLVVGERTEGRVRYYTTWKELFEKTFRVVAPHIKPGLRGLDYGSSYPYIARAALILVCRDRLAGACKALKFLEAELPNEEQVLSEDPTWAFSLR